MQSSAEIVADTISPAGARITTMRLVYPRCIHSQLLRHTSLRRNVMSSRAVPTKRMLEIVKTDPYVPNDWRRNASGMRSDDRLTREEREIATRSWLEARDKALLAAESLIAIGAHKQHVNRLLEPYLYVAEYVTATVDGWENMLFWRCAPDADPEAQIIAGHVARELRDSTPIVRDVHSPLTSKPNPMVCAGRIARVTYAQDTLDEPDEKSASRAIGMLSVGHIGPFEHHATATVDPTERVGAYLGWRSYRHERDLDNLVRTRDAVAPG